MISLKSIRAFQIELEFGSVSFWGEGKTVVPGEKPLGARERTNNKLNPQMALTPGFKPRPHLIVGGECSWDGWKVIQSFKGKPQVAQAHYSQ